jgi:hypothetical protein
MGDRRSPKELWTWERLPHWKASRPVTARAKRVLGRNRRHTSGIAQGITVRSPSHARETPIAVAETIARDATLVPKGLVPRYSEAPCAMLIFHDAFERRAASPNTTAKLTPLSGWRIIALHVEREGQ